MPIDLTKVIQDPTTAKPKFVPSYFQAKLTGKGGMAGLFNKTNTIVNQNIDFYIDPVKKEVDIPYSKHVRTLLYKSYENKFQYHKNIENYEVSSNHLYDLSPLSVLKQIEASNMRNNGQKYNNSTVFESAPTFLKNTITKEIGKNAHGNRISFGIIVDQIEYTKYLAKQIQNNQQPSIENFAMFVEPVIKIENDNATKDRVTLVNDIDDFTNAFQHFNDENEIIVLPTLDVYSYLLNDMSAENQEMKSVLNVLDQKLKFNDADLNQKVQNVLNDININDVISSQAKTNHDSLLTDIPMLFQFYDNFNDQFNNHRDVLMDDHALIKLEESNYSDSDYQTLYQSIKKRTLDNPNLHGVNQYNAFKFSKLISVNTRLSLTHELAELAQNNQVHQFKPTVDFTTKDKYSQEQMDVIKTTEPYSIVVAGAGSGKSHTLLGRLRYLIENHVDLKNVLVTSFTNTAAQNIINRFGGGINSLTNANLFHKIYQNNFDHELTNDDTIVNLLNIVSDQSKLMQSTPTIKNTKHLLTKYIGQTINQGYRRIDMQEITENLIALINDRLDDIIKILDGISQTSLLLEPIIINALMQNQVKIDYPDELSDLDYIITDESQDTSTFEYVLLLQLAKRNNAQMMIIGDSNQTLYEFRNANPDFLNALERSQTFHTYQMSTNYRSQQSILSLTNQFLDVLKTNQNTKLQLHANQYVNLTPDKFKASVKLANMVIQPKSNRSANIKNEITESILNRQDITDWVINQYANHKQIAIMAYRNNDTQAIGDAVAKIIRNTFDVTPSVGFTRKPQPRSNTWLSQMMSQTRDPKFEAQTQSTGVSPADLYQSLKSRLQVIANQKYYNKGIINGFALEQIQDAARDPYIKASLNDLNHHRISFRKFEGYLAMTLIKAENQKNNTQRLLQSKDDNTDWEDADIVVSTIHSAKGLEFDSVICYFDETMKSATNQENLRLYGVALTRAKDQELIINRPKTKKSQTNPLPTNFGYNESDMFKTPMRTAYERVLQKLHKLQQSTNNNI